jgi:microcystin-dependent protein
MDVDVDVVDSVEHYHPSEANAVKATTTTTATNQVQDAADDNSDVDPSETNDAVAEAQVAAPGGTESDNNNLGRYMLQYSQLMVDVALLQAEKAAADLEATQGNRTPIGAPVDTLSVRSSKKRKTMEQKGSWRQVKKKENLQFENELHKAI